MNQAALHHHAMPRKVLNSLLTALLLAGSGLVHAQNPAAAHANSIDKLPADLIRPRATAEPQAPIVSDTRSRHVLSLSDMGARYPLNLRGVEGSDTVAFHVPLNELVVSARLNLIYAWSPGLLDELSHINVLVNDQVAYSLPVPREQAGSSQQRSIDIPPYLITSNNRLRLQLIGHYTLDCEDPLHSTLWANISNQSTLELTTERLKLPNDLSLLPSPFFDPMDTRPVTVPVVIAQERDAVSLEAAGTVASWLGTLGNTQGVGFTVSFGQNFPARGSAIVIAREATATQQTSNRRAGASVSIRENPNDPLGKLLVISGRTDSELRTAARALSTGRVTLAGETVIVSENISLGPRQPYDAPNWLPSNRAFRLGEWFTADELAATGYGSPAIRLPLRIAPDLFAWRQDPVPLELSFRYTPQPGRTQSVLLINTDGQFINSAPLLSQEHIRDDTLRALLRRTDELPVKAPMTLPLERLLNQSGLDFQFVFDYEKVSECRDALSDNVRGAIDPDTTLDLSGYPHFKVMPDLSALEHSGFPFTRMADLSETTVVFPPAPATHDIATYLTLMARFGHSTGYPATAVKVAFGNTGLQSTDDLLVIASGPNPWLANWISQQDSPLNALQQRFATSDMVYALNTWTPADARERENPARTELEFSRNGDLALITGFESPNAKGKSVVVVAATSATAQENVTRLLLEGDARGQRLAGSASVLNQNTLTPLVSDYTYHVGALPPLRYLEWLIAPYWRNAPSLHVLAGVGLFLFLILVWSVWRRLTRRKRLANDTPPKKG